MTADRLRVRQCRSCRQVHWCDAPISQCFCTSCSSDQIDTLDREPWAVVRAAVWPDLGEGVGL